MKVDKTLVAILGVALVLGLCSSVLGDMGGYDQTSSTMGFAAIIALGLATYHLMFGDL